jgi:hypothetical protein
MATLIEDTKTTLGVFRTRVQTGFKGTKYRLDAKGGEETDQDHNKGRHGFKARPMKT